MRIIIKRVEPAGERKALRNFSSGTLKWTPFGWDVEGSVFMQWQDINTLPFRFHQVDGNFDISFNHLISLEGSPRIVGGNFRADSNAFNSLKGAPKKIFRNLSLLNNSYVTTLNYFPEEVGGDVYLGGTNILRVDSIPGVRGIIHWTR